MPGGGGNDTDRAGEGSRPLGIRGWTQDFGQPPSCFQALFSYLELKSHPSGLKKAISAFVIPSESSSVCCQPCQFSVQLQLLAVESAEKQPGVWGSSCKRENGVSGCECIALLRSCGSGSIPPHMLNSTCLHWSCEKEVGSAGCCVFGIRANS